MPITSDIKNKKWPTTKSGPINGAPGEKWFNVDAALRVGSRGFPGGSTLPQLLAEKRGVRNTKALPKLTVKKILRWADAYYERHNKWPSIKSVPIDGAPGETWRSVDSALREGARGFRGGSSLHKLLVKHRGKVKER